MIIKVYINNVSIIQPEIPECCKPCLLLMARVEIQYKIFMNLYFNINNPSISI